MSSYDEFSFVKGAPKGAYLIYMNGNLG